MRCFSYLTIQPFDLKQTVVFIDFIEFFIWYRNSIFIPDLKVYLEPKGKQGSTAAALSFGDDQLLIY